MKKRIVAILLSLCLVISMMPATALAYGEGGANITYIGENSSLSKLQGKGTEAEPYLISSAADLDKIRYYIVDTGEADTTDTINSKVIDGYFKLTTDVDCSAVATWIPIGRTAQNQNVRYKTAFVGTFDGGGYTISNLTLNTDYSGIGLFTRVGKGGTIKNLTIDNCTNGTGSTMQEVGAVCGTAWGATFSDITLNNIKIYGGAYAGALSGDIWTTDEVGTTVTNCSVKNSTISGGAATGGMFGRTHKKDTLTGCTVSNTNVTASGHSVAGLAGILGGPCENCHTTNVTVTSTMSGTAYAGGLFGQGSSTLIKCSASGTVSAGENGQQAGGLGAYYTGSKIEICSADVNVDAKNHVGGLIGFISRTPEVRTTEVKNCHATGNVTITAATNDNHTAGGLIGRIDGGTVTNCYATGTVTDLGSNALSANGNNTVGIGGLLGVATSSTITGSYATGTVTGSCTAAGGLIGKSSSAVQNCYATGNVTGSGQSGGFVGLVQSGTITNSYATGTVTSDTYAGGFAGNLSAGITINSAAASGNVTATNETNGIAGGFVGYIYSTPNIKNALATGTVSAVKAGAFVGHAGSAVNGLENCYANSESSIPFTGNYSGYYSPQNCFYGGNVTGMLASGKEPNGSSWQNYDYYYAKMDFSVITASCKESLSIPQTNTIGSGVTDTPLHTLTVKVTPETLVGSDRITLAGGSGTVDLVMTVNGKDFTFGSANVTVNHNNMTETPAKAATCTEDGNNAYWTCSACNKVYKADKTTETSVAAETIKAAHDYGNLISEIPATYTTTGTKEHYECSVCHKNFDKDKNELSNINIPVKDPAPYTITVNNIPANIYAGERATGASATLYSEYGANYPKVHFVVEVTTPAGATVQILAKDSNGVEWDMAKVGWGPAEGFAIGGPVNNVTAFDILADKTGEYTASFQLIDLQNNNTVITRGTQKINVVNRPVYYIPPVQKPVIGTNDNAKTELSSDGTKLTITAEEGYKVVDVLVNGVSKGAVTELTGLKTGDKVEVVTEKIEESAADSDAEQARIEKIIKGVEDTTLKARSTKTEKGIKITWEKSKGYKVDYYEIYRSTKRYSGYGKEPFFTTKSGEATSYTNTKDLTKGTTYYYKVRGVRIIDGKKVYTEYSTKAWRTW